MGEGRNERNGYLAALGVKRKTMYSKDAQEQAESEGEVKKEKKISH